MISVYQAAADLQRLCDEKGWRFCFIGGIAIQRWGEPRYTQDADLTLLTQFIDEEKYVDALLGIFPPRRPDARAFALQRRVLLIQHPNGVPLDVALGALPFEERSVERSSLWKAAVGCELRTCSAEDLIVHKAFAARGQDWADIERILQRQGPKLDMELVFKELQPLVELKEQPELLDQLRRLWEQHRD
jgi:predicted nucleotidyltransferase